MSQVIDQKIVELQMDSKSFQDGTKSSIAALDTLKKGLNFDNQVKGLSDLDGASRKLSFQGISNGVDAISQKLSIFGVIGFTVIQNLTESVIRLGQKLLSDFLRPVQMGFAEYETQMNAVQTTLANTASKGTTLDDVSAALRELNTYADKTIYNFTEMTRNIGTFTAAGIDLDTSVAAIKGIANLAAVSGSNSQQASTAMYQLSQALASGTVKLMDWNSVVNAGMGGQVFQDALKETARLHGVSIDQMIEQEGSFRETLQKGWLTSDVLLETLKKFTGDLTEQELLSMGYTVEQIDQIVKLGQTANDAATKVKTFTQLKDTLLEAIQSGWTQSWEIIFGDFDEAKALFTEISDVLGAIIGSGADARNDVLTRWDKFAGRTAIIDSIRNSFNALLSIVEPIKQAWLTIFPTPDLGLELAVISARIRKFTEGLILDEETASKFKSIFTGIFTIFDIGKDIVLGVLDPIREVISTISIDGQGILDYFVGLSEKVVAFAESTDIREKVSTFVRDIVTNIQYYASQIPIFIEKIRQGIEDVKAWFADALSGLDFTPVTELFSKFTFDIEPIEGISISLTDIFSKILEGAKKLLPFMSSVVKGIGQFVIGISEFVSGLLDGIDWDKLNGLLSTGLTTGFITSIISFVNTAGILATSFNTSITGFIGSGTSLVTSLSGSFVDIKTILDGFRGTLQSYQDNLKAKTLFSIAAAVALLAASLIGLSFIDPSKLLSAGIAITTLFADLTASMAIFNKIGFNATASAGIIAFGVSILLITGALSIIANIPKEQIKNGISALIAIGAGMLAYTKVLSGLNTSKLLSSSLGMTIFGVSVLIMASAVKKLSSIDSNGLGNGLLALGAVLAEILIFMNLIGDGTVSVKGALGMTVISLAILIMAEGIEKLGSIKADVIKNGLLAMGGILAEIAIFVQTTGSASNVLATSVGMIVLTGALYLLSFVIEKFGEMSWDTMSKGLAAMAGGLLIFSGALNLMPKDSLIKAVAIAGIAASMLLLSKVLSSFSDLSWEDLGKQMAGLAGTLAILAIALYAMTGTVAGSAALVIASLGLLAIANSLKILGGLSLQNLGIALLGLAAIFVAFGVAGSVLTPLVPTLLSLGGAMFLIGAGVALLGGGLALFAFGLASLAASGLASAVTVAGMVTTFLGLIPVVMSILIEALIVFGEGVEKAAPVIGGAISALLKAFLQLIIDNTPLIYEALKGLLLSLIQLIVDVGPPFIEAVILLLTSLLQTVAEKAPEFIQAGWDILIAFLQGFRDNLGEVVILVGEIIVEFLNALGAETPDVIQAGVDLIIDFIDGMAKAIDENHERVITAIQGLVNSIITGLVEGLWGGIQLVIDALVAIMKEGWQAAMDAVGAHSPAKKYIELAEYITMGLVVGLKRYGKNAVKESSKLSDTMTNAFAMTSSDISSRINSDFVFKPRITPVVDFGSIDQASTMLTDIFSEKRTVALATATNSSFSSKTNEAAANDVAKADYSKGSVIFNQNNYSPKALSEIEIYRQTNRLLMKKSKGL